MQRAFADVRQRLVSLMRLDPPLRLGAGHSARSHLERWLVTRLAAEDLQILFRLEELYGEPALAELLAEALLEAGAARGELN